MRAGNFGTVKETRYIDLARVGTTIWDGYADKIREVYEQQGGIPGIMSLVERSYSTARRIAIRFGLFTTKSISNTDKIKKREEDNRVHLLKHWGWEVGKDTIILSGGKRKVASKAFWYGELLFRPGDEYLLFYLPRGNARRHLEENGVKYVRANEHLFELHKLKHASLKIKPPKVDC